MVSRPRNSSNAERRFQRNWHAGSLLIAVGLLWFVSDASGCPTCKESLASSSGNSIDLVRGFGWSIIFMMSAPFVILGGLGSYFYLLVRQARKAAANSAGSFLSSEAVASRY